MAHDEQSRPAENGWITRFELLVARMERLAEDREAGRAALLDRVGRYEAALREAVTELDQTRSSFRSRRLRDLRLRMQDVLMENQARTQTKAGA